MYRLAAALAIGAATLGAADVAAGAARPDLRVVFLVDPPSPSVAGGQFSTAATVRNAGGSRAGRSTLRFYLSRDGERSASDVRLADHRLRALRRGDETTVGNRLLVPETTAPGEYFLIACADATRRVRERDERHNCLTSAFLMYVQAP